MSSKKIDSLTRLTQMVNEWVDKVLPSNYPVAFPKKDSTKVIREAVLGYHVLQPYEYLILDSPVVQRTRYVSQTALSYLVYPTARHTRFDHSLGMAKIAEKLGHSLTEDNNLVEELRLACLLHDVGHSFFSHLSEGLIKNHFDDMFSEIKENTLFQDCKTHEIISYLITTSPKFRSLLEKIFSKYEKNFSINRVCRLIIGKPEEPKTFAWMGDIIHGPFDADKLDYLVRDCYFTGIRADVDVDRIEIATGRLDTSKYTDYPNANLIMKLSGVSNLEQTVLNKILLYTAIYHHHKVRAIECMVKAVFETIWEDPSLIKNPNMKFEKVTDFLDIAEYDFFSMGLREPRIEKMIKRLLSRDLLKRCLIIAPNYILQNHLIGQHDLFKLGDENPQQIHLLRELIWDEIPKKHKTSINELWVDIPDPPNIDEDVERCFVDVGTSKLLRLRDFFPYGRWLDSYEANKLQGHVFYTSDYEKRKAVNTAALTVFENLDIKFKPAATERCKIQIS